MFETLMVFLGAFSAGSLTALAPCSLISVPLLVGASLALNKTKQKHPQYNIEFVDVKHEREAAYKFAIRMIPTQVIFDANGKEVYRHIGVVSQEELAKLFETYSF